MSQQPITDEARRSAVQALTPALEHAYSAPESGETMMRVFTSLIEDLEQYVTYATIVGDTILGFHHSSQLPALLQQQLGVSADTAQHIVASLAELLTPVLEREKLQANPKLAEMKQLHDQFTAAPGTAPSTPAATPTATPSPTIPESAPADASNDVQPMRTMAGDMNRVHGYGAYRQINPDSESEPVAHAQSQDDLLKRVPLSETPKVE